MIYDPKEKMSNINGYTTQRQDQRILMKGSMINGSTTLKKRGVISTDIRLKENDDSTGE